MSKYSHLSDEELLAQYKKRLPGFRRTLARLTSLLKNFFGKTFSAFATDIHVEDVSGRDDSGGGDSSNSLTVSGFKAPSAAKLRGLIDTQTYADDLDFLEESVARMKRSKGEMNQHYAEAKRLRDAMVVTFNKSLDSLTEVAEKSIPDNVGNLFKKAEKALEKTGEIAGVYLSVGVDADKGIHFVQMLDISNWERESKTAILALVVTAVLSETSPGNYTTNVFVNVHDKSVLPFRYNLGVEVVGKDVNAIAGKLGSVFEHQLAAHHVVAVIGTINLPVDDVTVKTLLEDISGVKGVSVFEDSIEVEIPGDNENTIGNVVRALNAYPPLRKLISGHHSARFAAEGNGIWKYTISRKRGDAPTEIVENNGEHHILAARVPLGKAIGVGNVTKLLTAIRGVGKVKVTENAIEIEIPGDKRMVADEPLAEGEKPKPKGEYNDTKTVINQILAALNSYEPIRKLVTDGQAPRFEQEVPGLWKYTISRKA